MSARRSERQGILVFALKEEPKQEQLTSGIGLTLVDEVLLALGVRRSVEQHVHIKERERGFSEEELVACFVVAFAAGIDCLDDFQVLREDKALGRLREMGMPSPDAARRFLYAFHEEELVEKAKSQRPPGIESYIPEESKSLQGLGQVNVDLIRALVAALGGIQKVTLDQDGTIIEAHKKEALAHYKGGRGYQPTLVCCPELALVLHDEFRDGNVPAGSGNLVVAKRAFAALPGGISEFYFRGDSACYEENLLKWLADPKRKEGPQAPIGFTISADMSEQLRKICEAVPKENWKMLEDDRVDETVEWKEVEFTPGDWSKNAEPLRYFALRIQKRQGFLFANGSDTKHLAIVTNRKLESRGETQEGQEAEGAKLIRWHWEKAGTIEHVHDVLKNDLAAGVLPCGRFGANAAWLRLNVLTFNALSALKQLALPAQLRTARPKRLRHQVLGMPGQLAAHNRKLEVHVGGSAERVKMLIAARQTLLKIFLRTQPGQQQTLSPL